MKRLLAAAVVLLAAGLAAARGEAPRYFAIEVVDEATGRGVPLVELQTTSAVRYYTDSNGLVAFYEPGLMGRKVWFGVSSHGYEFAPDGFGFRGAVLETKPGGSARLKIRRLNIAERLYRITGQGIYRDTVLLGRKPPIAEPLLNAEVVGQDSVHTALYRGRTYWFYGDTSRLSYPLGNFAMSGATTPLPERLDPDRGLDLRYFTKEDGFSRPMAPMQGEGVVWLTGPAVLPDPSGRERMLAYYERRRGLEAVLENGFVLWNDDREVFEKISSLPLEPLLRPHGNPTLVDRGAEGRYLYFPSPYPAVRVRAGWKWYLDPAEYEAYTCLKTGTRFTNAGSAELDRGPDGKLLWAWRKNTPPLRPAEQQALVAAGKMKREESPFRLEDAETGRPFLLHTSTFSWNAYRKRYVMIASEVGGATMLGEVWYSEAEQPEGPWVRARKIVTHANKKDDAHDFYNPAHHPFLDREGGRILYLEGTYVNTFSGNPHQTPYYDYNQIMYRLDLSNPRLRLDRPRPRAASVRSGTRAPPAAHAPGSITAFRNPRGGSAAVANASTARCSG